MKKNIGINKIIFIVFLASIFLIIGISVVSNNLPATSYASQEKTITVHYHNIDKWEIPFIYCYMDDYEGASWPGIQMKHEKGDWYSHTVYDMSQIRVIFSDNGKNQNPGQGETGYLVKNDMWYYNGKWYDQEPQNTVIHYYNSYNWSKVNIYYYQEGFNTPDWPGMAMNRKEDGWYTYEIVGLDHPYVIFNDTGNDQIPEQDAPGFQVTGEKWYYNGTWYDENPLTNNDDLSFKVHYYNYHDWNVPYIYYYRNGAFTPDWPGTAMKTEGDGWFEYEIKGIASPKVIFSDKGANQIPGQKEDGFTVSKEAWYRNGLWSDVRPLDINIYFYKPDEWNKPYVYYYESDSDTGPAWPGAAMDDIGNRWYKYTIRKYSVAKILFNDNDHQIPDEKQEGFEVAGDMWYKDGEWFHYNPDMAEDYNVTGDLNGDGVINEKDADLLDKYLSGEIQLTEEQKKLADTNGDGVVDDKDYDILNQYINGEITEFPKEDETEGFTDRNVSYEYDKLGRVIKVIYDSENYIEYVYDRNGNITDVKVTGKVN